MRGIIKEYDIFESISKVTDFKDLVINMSYNLTSNRILSDTNHGFFLCESFEHHGDIHMEVWDFKNTIDW